MGEKDLGCKILLDIDEVFADVINVLIFKGRRVVKEEDLSLAQSHSQFHISGKYREQIRDVSKYWKNCGIRIAFFGIENENRDSWEMPLRIMSYDGGAYKDQISKKKKEAKKAKKVEREIKDYYPVVSLVLNFNTEKRWSAPTHLKQVIKIPDELEPFVNDYIINVIDVAFLDREIIDSFESDFYIVADYFWKLRNEKEYTPSEREVRNVQEVLQMMSAITGDNSFEEVYNELDEELGGDVKMERVFDKVREDGKEIGKKIGKEIEREQGIKNLIETCVEIGATPDIIEEKLVEKYSLSHEEAKEKIEKYSPVAA